MDLDTYVPPVIAFVRDNAAWAPPIMFALAFGESLAFISLLIPAWGGAGRDRRADRAERHQFLAGVDRQQPRRRLRRLAVLLDRAQARAFGRAHLAAVAPSRSDPDGRSLHEEMGHARNFYRPLLWAVTRRGAADRRHFRDAVLALSARKFFVGFRLGRRAAHDRRCHFEGAEVVVALTGEKTPPGFCPGGNRRIGYGIT